MFFSVPSDLLFTYGGEDFGGKYWGTIPPRRFKKLLRDHNTAMRFAKGMFHRRLSLEDRLALTRQCFVHADRLRRPDAPLFILGSATQHGQQAERTRDMRIAFNGMCKSFCDSTPNAHFIDVDRLLDEDEFADSDHYTRTGYFKVAEFVNKQAEALAKIGTAA